MIQPFPGAVVDFNFFKKAATALVYQALVAGVLNTIAIQGNNGIVIANQASALNTDQVIINAAEVYVAALGGGSVFVDQSVYTLGANVAHLAGVYLYGSGPATILTIPAATDDCIEVNGVADWKIAFMTLRTTGAGASDAIALVDADDGEIFSVVIDDSGQDGISVDVDCVNIRIHDNDISGCVRRGIYNFSDEIILTDNRVSVCEDGIYFEDADLGEINDNIVTDCTRDGMRLAGDSDENTIMDNEFTDNTDYGINVSVATCNENWCKNNKLSGNTAGAINDAGTDTKLPEIFIEVGDANTNLGAHPAVGLPDEVDTTIRFQILIPMEWQETVRAQIIVAQTVTVASPDMQWSTVTNFGKICSDQDYDARSDAETDQTTAITQNDLECISVISSLDGIVPGDLVGFTFIRRATQAGDEIDGAAYYLGFRMQYV